MAGLDDLLSAPPQKSSGLDELLNQTPKDLVLGSQNPPVARYAKGFISSLAKGITNDPYYQPEQPKLQGSAIQPREEKTLGNYETAGNIIGKAIPWVVSGFAAGETMPVLAAKYGIGAVRAAILSGALTGATHGALTGAIENKPVPQSLDTMQKEALGTALLSAGEQGILGATNYLTKDAPESIANNWLKAPQKIRVKNTMQANPSLGEQYLNTDLPSARDKAFAEINNRIGILENRIQGRIEQLGEQAATPNNPDVAVKGTPQLEYKPAGSQVVEVNPSPYPPTANNIQTQEPYGKTYETMVPGRQYRSLTFQGRSAEDTIGPGNRANFADAVRSLNPIEETNNVFKQGPNVDLNKVVNRRVLDNVVDDMIRVGQETNPNDTELALLQKIRNDPNGYLTIGESNDFRRMLDKDVGNAHLNVGQPSSKFVMAKKYIADSLRNANATADPELADMLAQQHQLLQFRTALAPQVELARDISQAGGFTSRGIRAAQTSMPAARALQWLGNPTITDFPTVGTNIPLTPAINLARQTARVGGQMGLSQLIEEKRK